MQKFLTAALLAATLAAPALAAEGGRDPFPFNAPGQITEAVPQGFDVGQNRLPELPPAYSFAYNGEPTTEPNNREGQVQTAGSLPRNALVGTVEFAQAREVTRWFASRPGLQNVAQRRVRPGA